MPLRRLAPLLHAPLLLAPLLLAVLPAAPAAAHEFWIAPEDFTPEPGQTVRARVLVGQMLKGEELPWLSHRYRSFRIVTAEGAHDATGLDGDLPALSFTAAVPGLHVVALETEPLTVTFDAIADFADYLDYEGLGAVVEAHRRRGLPEHGIAEAYARVTKALVQAGPVGAEDRDRPLGLPFELVALASPYAGGETLPVRLLWQGKPEAGAQVSVFREGEPAERTLLTTDAGGRAEVPIGGGGRFVLNAVHIEPVEGAEHVWASTWASLSFAVPPAE